YFGRAKELPGVRELFSTSAANEAELESYKAVKVTQFDNAPPAYYGDFAEQGDAGRALLDDEREAEKLAWEEAVENLESEFEELPSIAVPTRSIISLAGDSSTTTTTSQDDEEDVAADEGGKRKAPTGNGQTKKSKLDDGSASATTTTTDGKDKSGFESIFEPELLRQPKLLTADEMEKVLVGRQKEMLLAEYGA
ncbi:hypothetical protein JCM11491_006516, partial [Sporobolomyces phaffii]